MHRLTYPNCRQDRVMNKKKWRESVIGSSSQSSSKPRSILCLFTSSLLLLTRTAQCSYSNYRRSDLEMARDLQPSEDSVRLTPTKHLASWPRTNGVFRRPCWQRSRRHEYQALLAKNSTEIFVTCKIHRGYYTVARRYEFYVRVARTISHE